MDTNEKSLTISRDLQTYAEKNRILEIFKNMFERLVVDRPENPVEYLFELLSKRGLYDVPKVYVLGLPTMDRKLVCSALASRLKLIYITQKSLMKDFENDYSKENLNAMVFSDSELAELVKKRVEVSDCMKNGWLLEAFPRTRRQAFALRKAGVFPSHIIVIENDGSHYQSEFEADFGISGADQQKEKNEILEFVRQRRLILDLHKKSYIKCFRIEKYSNIDVSLDKVIEFVRSKQRSPLPYLPRVIILGPYGSGRKTMAEKLAQKYHLIKIDYQEELRRAALKKSPLQQKLYEILKTSQPVPDEILVEVASRRLLEKDCIENGWVMVNFPDTSKQAELLVESLQGYQVNRVIFLGATLWTCKERVEPKRFDPATGNIYHLKWQPCTEMVVLNRLIQLLQDTNESVERDHEIYSTNVSKLREFFGICLLEDIVEEVNANLTMEEVFESVQRSILKSAKIKLLF